MNTPTNSEALPHTSGSPSSRNDDMASAIGGFIDDLKRGKQDATNLAGELVALIRVNSMRGCFKKATHEQVEECLAPFIARLRKLQSPENAAPTRPALPDGGGSPPQT